MQYRIGKCSRGFEAILDCGEKIWAMWANVIQMISREGKKDKGTASFFSIQQLLKLSVL